MRAAVYEAVAAATQVLHHVGESGPHPDLFVGLGRRGIDRDQEFVQPALDYRLGESAIELRRVRRELEERRGMLPPGGGFDPSMMFGPGGGGGRGATKKRQDPKARKNKRKQQRNARKKKRKK